MTHFFNELEGKVVVFEELFDFFAFGGDFGVDFVDVDLSIDVDFAFLLTREVPV